MDPVKKHLVLNGSLGPDKTFKIHVSSSMYPIGPELVDLFEDAEISITDENSLNVLAQHDSMGFYMADWYPEINHTYRITVKAPTFEDAYVDITVPEKLARVSLSNNTANTTYPYALKISDISETDNTYMIRAWYQHKETHQHWLGPGLTKYDTIITRNLASLHSTDELIGYYADGTYIGDEVLSNGPKSARGFLISDELFNGRDHTLNFKYSYVWQLDPDRPYLYVEVVSLKSEFYKYVKSYCLYFDALQTPFAEPVAILTNIQNGLGYVYGYSIWSDSIKIK